MYAVWPKGNKINQFNENSYLCVLRTSLELVLSEITAGDKLFCSLKACFGLGFLVSSSTIYFRQEQGSVDDQPE